MTEVGKTMSYVALKPCGCLAIAIVDNPAHAGDIAREIAKGIRQGYHFDRVPSQRVREMALLCALHRKEEVGG